MTPGSPLDEVRVLLAGGVTSHAFPGAVLEVGTRRAPVWRAATGRFTYDEGSAAVTEETIFDLASLTKVIVTTSLAMRLVEKDDLSLADRVSVHVRDWRSRDRARVTIRDLLEHCTGLAGWAPLHRDHQGREGFARAIASSPLEYAPWIRSLYSDLGFMLLGFILEDLAGPLGDQFARIGLQDLGFTPDAELRARIAPTEYDSDLGRLLAGEVHDENARALGGVAGHAGLFGPAAGVGTFARLVLQTGDRETALGRPDTLRRFTTRSTVPGSSRALGWDTMLPTSSCGALLSSRAIGHVGFTGTSLWIDPARDLYVVLLSNRVHPTRDNDRLRVLRPAIHDAVVQAMT